MGGMLGSPRVAFAQDGAPNRLVFVLDEPSPASGVLRTFDRLQGQLGELELEIETVHAASHAELPEQARQAAELARKTRAAVAIWFEARTAGTLRIYALHAQSGRVYARDVDLSDEATVQREQVAVVLRAAVPAVLSGGAQLGAPLLVVPRDPSVDAAPSLPAVPSPGPVVREHGRSTRLRAALGYDGTALAWDANIQHGVLAALVLDAGAWLRVGLGAGYTAEASIPGDQASAIVRRLPFFAKVGARWSAGGPVIGVEVGPVLEAWHRRTAIHAGRLQPTEPSTVWRYGGAVSTRAELGLGPHVALYLSVEGQWFPVPHTVSVESERGEQRIETHSVRPHLGLGLLFDVVRIHAETPREKTSTFPGATGHQ